MGGRNRKSEIRQHGIDLLKLKEKYQESEERFLLFFLQDVIDSAFSDDKQDSEEAITYLLRLDQDYFTSYNNVTNILGLPTVPLKKHIIDKLKKYR